MYVCRYVVCIYVCMHVCTYVCTTYVCCMHLYTYARMHTCVVAFASPCVYVGVFMQTCQRASYASYYSYTLAHLQVRKLGFEIVGLIEA